MEGSSNALLNASAYLNASNTNVTNFVSVKLSSDRSYPLWKAQMLCLLKSINACGVVDDAFVVPRYSDQETMREYDNLVSGWIFGSVTEDVLVDVYYLSSAKAVWKKLQSTYDPPVCLPENSVPEKFDAKAEKEVTNVVSNEEDTNSIGSILLTEMVTKERDTPSSENIKRSTVIVPGDLSEVESMLKEGEGWTTNAINSDGSTILHINQHVEKDLTSEKPDAKAEIEDINVVPLLNSIVTISTEIETKNEETQISEQEKEHKKKLKMLKSAIVEGDWPEVKSILKKNNGLATDIISNDGSTALHIAVGLGYNDVLMSLLQYIDCEQVLKQRDFDGSTALHIAAIVGNKEGAELLVKKNKQLLLVQDKHGSSPSNKAYEHMHLDTMAYLLEAISCYPHDPCDECALVELAVNAISARKYSIALQFLQYNPKAASRSDEVLMAIAKNFPSGLDRGEKLIYPPSLKSIWEILGKTTSLTVFFFILPALMILLPFVEDSEGLASKIGFGLYMLVVTVISTGPLMLASALAFIFLLVLIVSLPFLLLYHLCWKGAKILAFPPIKKIENKIKDRNEAKKLLAWVCDEIDKLNYPNYAYHPRYAGPIIEATCQNAYDVVDEILTRSPEAIQSKDKNEYNIILLAIINRSEKIYNRIYDVGEGKNLYRRYEDSSKNNILHLAGKLASSNVLNQRTGAALQLQREIQWREEVKKLVTPAFITKENIFKETPDMVFTREHKDLMKDGEQWMKTTAESCSITAALITTIVFAAAITVPGGSNQETGTPLFKKETAFIIFAISDAISLFASTTALLVFLSILTARFAEKDFLVSLPRRLFIGLFSLLLSTTTMMVAFSATVFLVFCDKKLWMLAPICGLAFIPIASFVSLQFPLLVDLFSSAYLPIFGRERKNTPKDFIRRIHGYLQ